MAGYQASLSAAMELLSLDKKVIFLGQAVAVAGTAMQTTLEDISKNRLYELPV